MMNYTFYQSTTSPFVRKIRILIEELRIADQVDFVRGLNKDTLDQHPNPLIKIPALVTPDMGVLFDSLLIAEYLDHKFARGKYFPINFRNRIEVLRNHAVVDGALDAAVLILYEKMRPAELQSATEIDKQAKKIHRAISYLAGLLGYFQKNWNFDTVTLVCLIDYLEFRFPNQYNNQDWELLKNWRTTLQSEVLTKTYPKES